MEEFNPYQSPNCCEKDLPKRRKINYTKLIDDIICVLAFFTYTAFFTFVFLASLTSIITPLNMAVTVVMLFGALFCATMMFCGSWEVANEIFNRPVLTKPYDEV